MKDSIAANDLVDAAANLMQRRRSIRAFLPDTVEPEILHRIHRVIREVLDWPDWEMLVCGMSLGDADREAVEYMRTCSSSNASR